MRLNKNRINTYNTYERKIIFFFEKYNDIRIEIFPTFEFGP